MKSHAITWLCCALMILGGCGDSAAPQDDSGADAGLTLSNLPGGNPLVPEVAMMPYPSDFYLADDTATITGRRVTIPAEALPESLLPETFSDHDGFSRIPLIVTFLPGGVDVTSLPDPADPSAALDDASSVHVVRVSDGARVPLLVEPDATSPIAKQQSLLIRPMHVLDANTQYVVIVKDTVRNMEGGAHQVGDAFRALRDNIPTNLPELESRRTAFETVRQAISDQNIDINKVLQAWSFHTRSEEQVVTPLIKMQQVANSTPLAQHTINSDAVTGNNRLVRGTIPLPNFLDPADGRIKLDASGDPIQHGTRDVEFLVTIPTSITTPRPVIVFGHGFFSTLEEPTFSRTQSFIQERGFSTISTNFEGFSEPDLPDVAAIILGDLFKFDTVVAKQLQSQTHFTALARLMRDKLADELLGPASEVILDKDEVHYYGISNGGTQGLVIMATSPAFTRGVMSVAGGALAHMLERAVQWGSVQSLLTVKYSLRELQLVMSLVQAVLDPMDSMNYIQHLATNRFAGLPEIKATVHMAVGDCQVANFVTEAIMRSGDIPLVSPAAKTPWDLTPIAAPAAGAATPVAFFIHDENYPAKPLTNIAPTVDNGAHGTLHDLPTFRDIIQMLLEEGKIVNACDGACDPN